MWFRIKFLLMCLMAANAFAAIYIVPQTYDNVVNSMASSGFGVINQATPTLSGNTYTIGGQTGLQYRCLQVQKITCRSSTSIAVFANTSDVSLRDPTSNESLNVYSTDVRVEDGGSYFNICGAAYGGITFDTFSMSVAGSTINYSYQGNVNIRAFPYFTSYGNSSSTSYMTLEYKQVCR